MTEAEITELRVVVDEVRMAGIVAGSGGGISLVIGSGN